MINHLGTKKIQTQSCILRKFEYKDIDDVYKNWANDDLALKYIDFPKLDKISKVEDFILKEICDYCSQYYCWAIVLKSINQVIGSIQINNIDDENYSCEVGFVLGSKFWNKGYATQILQKVLDFAIFELDFEYIYAVCHQNNKASSKVLEKCNMIYKNNIFIEIKNTTFIGKKYFICKNKEKI